MLEPGVALSRRGAMLGGRHCAHMLLNSSS